MLGFGKRRFEEFVTYSGEKAVDFAKIKTLYIDLEQTNSSNIFSMEHKVRYFVVFLLKIKSLEILFL